MVVLDGGRAEVLVGDCRDMLKTLPDASVHCVVTSPPYLGLRDYGTATWGGGEPECEHFVGNQVQDNKAKGAITSGVRPGVDASHCKRCGATRLDRQIGLEASPDEYVAGLLAVFREVRRVLHPSGVVWLNLGDSYAGSWGNQGRKEERGTQRPINAPMLQNLEPYPDKQSNTGRIPEGSGLKPKDLIGIPWLVAFALRADGWWLRQDIVWAKKAPMPESVTDRCTRSHEYVFMLTKAERYFYDAQAIAEPAQQWSGQAGTFQRESSKRGTAIVPGQGYGTHRPDRDVGDWGETGTRNKRDVWFLGPEPTPFAHFATMPQALVEPCILAGTSEKGCCPECLAPWERVVEQGELVGRGAQPGQPAHLNPQGYLRDGGSRCGDVTGRRATGWRPACQHDAEPIPCTILDPFAGSGTVLRVAVKHGRRAIGIELNPEYAEIIRRRLHTDVRLPLDFGEEAS